VTRTIADLTAQGVVVGTTRYMAPEQARGEPVDARADIFSFGAVLYEMIAGRHAFPGDSVPEISTGVLRDNPKSLSDVAPQAPRELERVVARCLRKDPARRFQTAADLKVVLEELREESESGQSPTGIPSTPRARSVGSVVMLAGALTTATALALWWSYTRPHPAPSSAEMQIVPLTSDIGGRDDASTVARRYPGRIRG